MTFGQGLVSSHVEDVARRERLVGFCRLVHMIFGQGLVSSHVEVCI